MNSKSPNALQRYLLERLIGPAAQHVLRHPWAFAWQTLKGFKANQGLLLAGAVAYYALLSIVPLLILVVIALSHVIDQRELLATLGRYLEWLVPGQCRRDRRELANFLDNRDVRRLAAARHHDLLQLARLHGARERDVGDLPAPRRDPAAPLHLLGADPVRLHPFLGIGLLLVTLVAGSLQAVGKESVELLGREWSLSGFSGALLYLLGLAGEVFVLTSVYLVMPAGRLRWRHALIGGITAAVLWEITRHVLVWYFATLSQVSVVYGSLTTAIVVLLSLEIGATLLLFGAQVISEYERIGHTTGTRAEPGFTTAAV